MYSFKITPLRFESCEWYQDEPIFEETEALRKIYNIKQDLNNIKSRLDKVYKSDKATGIMRAFDPFAIEKHKIARRAQASNVTNAWLKGYELLYTCDLIPLEHKTPEFVYFDNASFPGSFILAANHLVYTWSKIEKFSWHASSLLETTAENKEPIGDTYKLYKNYPERWLMNDENNGDVMKDKNIENFQKQFKNKYGDEHSVDLYSCDLGTNASDNYNAQEEIHFLLNISQIVCGLTTLKSGGNMVFKHYTIFEPFTISYVALLANLFESVHIVKPITSKRTNSEIYIICKKYLYPFHDISSNYIYYLFISRAIDKNTTPLISSKYIAAQINDIKKAMTYICARQISALIAFIRMAECKTKHDADPYYQKVHGINARIRQDFRFVKILPINKQDNLNILKIY
jgi:hypothetical protein